MPSPSPTVPPFLLRGVARGIDLLVQIAVMEFAFRCSHYLPPGGLVSIGDALLYWVDLSVGLGALLTYTSLSEWIGGATLGKLLTRMRVVPADGEPRRISLRAALVRGAAFFIDGMLFGLIAYSTMAKSSRAERLGDHWAGTVVVWSKDAPLLNGWKGWPIGLVAAFSLVMASYLFAS